MDTSVYDAAHSSEIDINQWQINFNLATQPPANSVATFTIQLAGAKTTAGNTDAPQGSNPNFSVCPSISGYYVVLLTSPPPRSQLSSTIKRLRWTGKSIIMTAAAVESAQPFLVIFLHARSSSQVIGYAEAITNLS